MHAIQYHRFSDSKQQKGSSLERQREITSSAIQANGWTAILTVEDQAASAWHGHHLDAELGKLTARAKAGEFPNGTVIVAEQIDRLSRLGHDSFRDWLKSIIACGLQVFTCDDRKLYDAKTIHHDDLGSKIAQMVKAEGARESVTFMRDRVIKGIRRNQITRLLTGVPDTHVHPKWLAYDDSGVLRAIPERAAAIRMIFVLSIDHGVMTIVKRMNESLHRPWTVSAWTATTIRHLLNHPSVDGSFQQMEFGKPFRDRIEGYYPAVVDNDLIARSRAARRMRERAKTGGKPSRDFINLFQSLTFCSGCRGRMHVQKSHETRTGITRRFFRCHNGAYSAGCDRKSMFRYGDFETGVLDHLLHLALDDRFFAHPDASRELSIQVADLERQLSTQKGQSERLLSMLMNPDIEPDPILIARRQTVNRQIIESETGLAKARVALEDARGSIDPALHMKRLTEVRDAASDPDLGLRPLK